MSQAIRRAANVLTVSVGLYKEMAVSAASLFRRS